MTAPVSPDLITPFHGFCDLSPETVRKVAAAAHLLRSPSGTIFYRQGDPASGLYLLRSGRVKLYRQAHERTHILALPKPGDWFGAKTLPNDSPCVNTAESIQSTTVIHIPSAPLRALLAECSDLQDTFFSLVSERLEMFVEHMHDLAFRDVPSRLAAVLVARAHIEGHSDAHGLFIERLLTQQEFADMVGTAREVVNRVFRRFEHEGLIVPHGELIYIKDLEGLTELAQREVG